MASDGIDAPEDDFVELGRDRVRVLRDGICAYRAMLSSIRQAQSEILLEMYWFQDDAVGELFRAALLERAKTGVSVCVIFDSIGSLETEDSFWRPMRDAGVEVLEFSPVSPLQQRFRLDRLMKRDHRKILIVDHSVAFTGGINIAEPWVPEEAPESGWRDDAVEIRGPSAELLRGAFLEVWRRFHLAKEESQGKGFRLRGARWALPFDLKRGFNFGAHRGRFGKKLLATLVSEGGELRVLINQVGRHPNHAIRKAYFDHVRLAKKTIDIASAYFLPGPLFLRALRTAVRRGVRVRLLVPKRSDVLIVSLAMRSLYERLLLAGVEIYEYGPRIPHAKTAIFDGRFVTVGSHNLDSISLQYNLECNVFLDSPELAAVMERRFEEDLLHAQPLDLAAWGREPLWLRLLAWFAALFRSFL